jgi:hypothetical protein
MMDSRNDRAGGFKTDIRRNEQGGPNSKLAESRRNTSSKAARIEDRPVEGTRLLNCRESWSRTLVQRTAPGAWLSQAQTAGPHSRRWTTIRCEGLASRSDADEAFERVIHLDSVIAPSVGDVNGVPAGMS